MKVPRVTMQFYIWQSKRGLLLLLWQNFLYPNIALEKVIRNLPLNEMASYDISWLYFNFRLLHLKDFFYFK